MGTDRWTTARVAWQAALYGSGGFYRLESPGDHFRTSAHVSADFAAAVLAMARGFGTTTVVDVGAGAGELLTALRERDAGIGLVGVDIRPRPRALAASIDWLASDGDAAAAVADAASEPTLVIANELLDNVPCDVVELATDGLREVEVDSASGRERVGAPGDPAVAAWIDRWWPLKTPGERAIAGLARDAFWTGLCEAVDEGVCVAVDFGHVADSRPTTAALTSYRSGRQSPACFDGRHDITADVAVDSVASAVGGRLARQREILAETVSPAARPSLDLAHSDPIGYLRRLSAAGDWRELTASPGLGDFWWIVSPRGRRTLDGAGEGVDAAKAVAR